MTTRYTARYASGKTLDLTRDQAIALVNLDPAEFDWCLEDSGACDGLDADGVEVRIVAADEVAGMTAHDFATLRAEFPEAPAWIAERDLGLEQARQLMLLRRRAFPKTAR